MRISIIGTSCSGKTTLAKNISMACGIDHIELDAIHWNPGWCKTPSEEFRKRVSEAVRKESWVADGNYKVVRDIIWLRATEVIWINYSFPVVFLRALRRTIARSVTKEELFSGNYETFTTSFLSRDSILLWVLNTYNRRRRDYPRLFKEKRYSHLLVTELSHPRQAEELLYKYGSRKP